ncbi:hypothetical protein TraAM80_10230 [Trypanosoma rangeli]|uniref:Secreted protein n=1 Tax=Trypanosoma rangeli TaxID=5698 RepID=A0A422MQC7_TRYRA|nr:uncharacterized protein TraAM80_10230 [Trypanosoma rangeli]RNE95409.1 hypothetical protein TraAM80_10230 [Trypanosoma rangeli]|eukprot:RNE95409.1 hypothetical protein TraAM80_10230 [Trypanosoma rangeli]
MVSVLWIVFFLLYCFAYAQESPKVGWEKIIFFEGHRKMPAAPSPFHRHSHAMEKTGVRSRLLLHWVRGAWLVVWCRGDFFFSRLCERLKASTVPSPLRSCCFRALLDAAPQLDMVLLGAIPVSWKCEWSTADASGCAPSHVVPSFWLLINHSCWQCRLTVCLCGWEEEEWRPAFLVGPPNASSPAASFPPQPDPKMRGRFLLLRLPGDDSTGAAHARRARVLFSHPFLATAAWPVSERAVDHSSERAGRPALGESWAARHGDFLGA